MSRLRKCVCGSSISAAVIALLCLSTLGHAAPRPDKIGDKPNLNGIWFAPGAANWNLEPHNATGLDEFWQLGAIVAVPPSLGVVDGDEIPYLPEARKQRDANRAAGPASDPESNCYLPGVPRASYMPYPFQIVQSPGDDILFVYEYASANRPVFMTEHREPPIDTWMGTSNGFWDRDTLVVETTGLNGKTWLDRSGNFAGAGAKVTERFTLLDDSHMRYEATIANASVFSRPWGIHLVLYRQVEPNAQLLEFRCVPFSEKKIYQDVLPSGSQGASE